MIQPSGVSFAQTDITKFPYKLHGIKSCSIGNRLILSQTHQFPWRQLGRVGRQVDPQRHPAGSPELLWPSCIHWCTPSSYFPASDWTLDHTSETTAQWTCISTTACFCAAVLRCFYLFNVVPWVSALCQITSPSQLFWSQLQWRCFPRMA